MKKNVLQLIGSFHQGGSERQAVQLAKLLKDDGTYNVFVATLNKKGVLLKEMESAGFLEIPEFRLKSFFDVSFLKQLKRCRKLLKDRKIHIVHTHDFYTNVFGILAAKLAGVKVKIASKRETEGMRTAMQKRIEKHIFLIADIITANSEAVKLYLVEQGMHENKIKVIYNGVDFERLKPKENDRKLICESLGLPDDERIKLITQVANLRHPIKNQEMLIRAAACLKHDFPDAHFVFAGEGQRKAELEAIAVQKGVSENTHFIGRCSMVPELLSISYIGVLTSLAEGFSNSILEYMYAEKPVVATRVGGASEAVIEGETGFLVEPEDDEELVKHLAFILADPKRANDLGINGRITIKKKFSPDQQLARTLTIYASAL